MLPLQRGREEAKVLDVFKDVPKFVWNPAQQKFVKSDVTPKLAPEVNTLVNTVFDRYQQVIKHVRKVSTIRWWDERTSEVLAAHEAAPPKGHENTGMFNIRHTNNSTAMGDLDDGHAASQTFTEGRSSRRQNVMPQAQAPWATSKRITLWPVACAIGTQGNMTLIGVLQKAREDIDIPIAAEHSGEKALGEIVEGEKWQLLDSETTLAIDTSKTLFEDTHFLEGMVAVVEGRMNLDRHKQEFVVHSMFHPPREVGDDALFPVEMWGGNMTRNEKALRLETHRNAIRDATQGGRRLPGESWVVLSEVNLDVTLVRRTLRRELAVIDCVVGRWHGEPVAAAPQETYRTGSINSLASSGLDVGVRHPRQLDLTVASTGDPFHSEAFTDGLPAGASIGRHQRHVPVGIVFMGSFMSTKKGSSFDFTRADEYTKCFGALTRILCDMPNVLKYCHLVFVPGPGDPGPDVTPRLPIPSLLTRDLPMAIKSRCPDASVTLASNPCRIRYRSKEMVFFRHNLAKGLASAQASLNNPLARISSPSAEELSHYIPHVVASQGHLSPLSPMDTQNCVAWDFDHALRINPPPDLVCIGDLCNPFVKHMPEFGNCIFFNPGQCIADKATYDVTMHDVSISETSTSLPQNSNPHGETLANVDHGITQENSR